MLDLTSINAGLSRLMAIIPDAIQEGLLTAAPTVQAALQDTNAHGDVTGATRASYRVIVVGHGRDGSAGASSGYAAANAANPGHAETVSGAVSLGKDEQALILTGFVEYLDKLQYENAGQRAALAPTLHAYATEVTRTIAGVSKERL